MPKTPPQPTLPLPAMPSQVLNLWEFSPPLNSNMATPLMSGGPRLTRWRMETRY